MTGKAEVGSPNSDTARLVRVRLKVAYDGAGFHGFADQPGVLTVAGVLTDALSRRLRQPVKLSVAGRTDSGVHAWGQVVSFDINDSPEKPFDPRALQRAINKTLAPAVVVREASIAAPDFDARHSARARHYRYQVLNCEAPDPFRAATAWHVAEPLDVSAMDVAAAAVVGERDFSSFCRVPRRSLAPASMVRRVTGARWVQADENLLRFEVEASSFCHQMVRSLVGTLVAVGLGRRRADEMPSILEARSRAAAPDLAPPHGLCLWEVVYP